jgi:ubiquinone/menaquinone biosynthesis C-methylase UbiE
MEQQPTNCQLKKYKILSKYLDFYKPPSSDTQIANIIKISKKTNFYYFSQLMDILLKKFSPKLFKKLIKKILSKPTPTDSEIYEFLRNEKNSPQYYQFFKSTKHQNPCNRHELMAEIFTKFMENKIKMKIKNYNKSSFQNQKYLDLGCGRCDFAPIFGKMLGINKDNIFGADIDDFAEQKNWKRNKSLLHFTQLKADMPLPYADNSFELISCFMVMHHVKNLDFFIKEVQRILKPNGYFLVTEHNAQTGIEKMLIDIEHIMYIKTFVARNTKKQDMNKNVKEYYGEYFGVDELLNKIPMKNIGLEYVSRVYPFHFPSDREYITIFQN